MSKPLRKVVFPVAGLGTRFLPATKVVAKEMLPVLDKPLIQYAVDEAVDAGADTLIFVTNRYKHAIADYFDKAYELEAKLHEKGKDALLALVQGTLPKHVRAIFVTQPEALGLGHAVLCAKPVVGDEPFGVMLPDDLIWNGTGKGALRQMAEAGEREQAGVIAVEEVPHEQTDKYGIVDAVPVDERSARIRHMVEKPKPAEAPSNLAVVGRYVLPGRIFELLERTTPGAGGEIQLTDAIEALLKEQGKVLAWRFEGTRFDCGNKAGLVRATMHMALQDPSLAPVVREIAATL
ncbi:MAG: UTP--glucose-1-phosphate uridylyltransferase [Rhodanobacter sp. 68-29]|uniref:UTP--glucose-1-phosphate uridylyltransferase GalU n=1 Tax=Rhodanobacter sp. PCA2 TaxID=2006117 RepID=UPI0008699894|nr:UTP--glucose-1-phosphate uridylyltransferase [Rhodanobacter sp. PCA2]MBN8921543.1 UTP--glucose-1-phosphate uridylyltransferase GalU [Rhodanobacter sp.]ODU74931.1 MAG: UTP--glucose-1-phosphate uridylyltransferase [Rhodanobacter sp. SCN 69-32]OJY61448.1 MAG: UTP--glucose-1-phosphate uridylyltransferase [Rhodanobacter sp. 68-29]